MIYIDIAKLFEIIAGKTERQGFEAIMLSSFLSWRAVANTDPHQDCKCSWRTVDLSGGLATDT
jgi:hypothetical protein